MGITSLVSYTLNASLPKARIIKELDDNIHKYREIYKITDKDIINLSTRIANRQIKDVEGINELAKKNEAAFAAKVKEESIKQEQIEASRVQKMDSLFKMLQGEIKNIQENQVKMQQKYNERLQILDQKEEEIKKNEQTINKERDFLKSDRERLISEKECIKNEKDKIEDRIKSLWKQENKKENNKKMNLLII